MSSSAIVDVKFTEAQDSEFTLLLMVRAWVTNATFKIMMT